MCFKLDCETGKTAIESLCIGFSCKENTLRDALLSIDIDKIYEERWKNIHIPSEEYLYNHIVDICGTHKPLVSVCWFHLTRTTRENNFSDGIHPLGQSLTFVWELILSIAKTENIKKNLIHMRDEGVMNSHYEMKHDTPLHWGPYAILVKEVAYHAKTLSQHDYLGMPEIIEDICNGYQAQFGESIIEAYEEFLIPKIVKFQSDKQLYNGCVEAALFFAYNYVRGLPPCSGAITCFDGNGVGVEAPSIISIDTINPEYIFKSLST